MKKYPKYKGSGVEWIGDIPEHWESWKLSHAFPKIGSGTTPESGNSLYYDGGTINWLNTGDLNDGLLYECAKKVTPKALEDYSALKLFPSGSLVMAMYGATIGKTSIINFATTTNQACCVFCKADVIDIKYLHFWFQGHKEHIIKLAIGGGQPNVSQNILKDIRLNCPEINEQIQIAKYLDFKTNQIEILIANKQKLIELLQEERTAIINQAVTKGINPKAKLKPSGIEWSGDVPEHWEVWKLSHAFSKIGSGTTPESGNPLYHEDGTINWLNTGDLNDDYLYSTAKKVTAKALEDYSALKLFPAGSVVIAMYGATIGKTSLVEFETTMNQACCIFYGSKKITNEFLFYWFQSQKENIINLAKGGGQPNISQDILKSIKVPCPDPKEQDLILQFIKRESDRIAKIVSKVEQEISLMQEYKMALISEVVTGKVDVRNELIK